MSLTWKKTADVNTSSKIKAAMLARTPSSAAAASATNAAQNAALAAQNAAALATAAATNAAQNASGAAQMAAAGLNKGVKQGVHNARSWAAPRLDSAADYCTTTVAPKVSAALHTTARQVSPADTTRSKRSSMLTWSLLGAAILAALGAAAAAARYRYRAAIAADSEVADEEMPADSAGNPDGSRGASEKAQEQDTETSVNGQVTASGR
ncbi:MAG: hypothetical protein JWO75_6661 [Actinomycetia bacterium]|jgi:hypothetical protein|nr:hypothetical protein [Actinomycetes bacterium]